MAVLPGIGVIVASAALETGRGGGDPGLGGRRRPKATAWRTGPSGAVIPLAVGLALACIQCGESSDDDDAAGAGEAGAIAGGTGGSSASGTGGSAAAASGGTAGGGQSATGGRDGTGGSSASTGGAATGGRGGASPQGGSTTTGATGAGGVTTGGATHTGGRTASGGTGGELGAGGAAGQAPVGGAGGEVSEGGAGGEAPIGGAAGEGGTSSGGASSGGTAGTGGSTGAGGTGGSGGTTGTGGSGGETIESCFAGLRDLLGSWQISTRDNTGEQITLRLALETDDRMGTSGTMPWGLVRLALEIDGVVICLDENDTPPPSYDGSLHNCADVLRFEYGGMTYEIAGPDVPKTATLTALSGETVVRGPITLSTTECGAGGSFGTECRSGGPC